MSPFDLHVMWLLRDSYFWCQIIGFGDFLGQDDQSTVDCLRVTLFCTSFEDLKKS